MVPFFGTIVPVKLRELTEAQILSCGDFSLIETFEDKIRRKKIKIKDIVAYSEKNHKILKEALVAPTYDQIYELIGTDPKVEEKKAILSKLEKKLHQCPPGPQRSALTEEINTMKIWCNYLLPDDFISHIVAYSLGIDKSDIKLISENMLLDCAILAEKGHDNPSAHIDGMFTPFMKNDINRRAWHILNEKRKEVAGGR
jgi:hypothetical protein